MRSQKHIPAPVLRWWPIPYLALVTAVLFSAFAAWAYDDPFITYRYAENIYDGLGMVYNPGERVLSTTTPLFALLLASLRFFSTGVPTLAHLIGAFSLGAGALFLWDFSRSLSVPAVGWAGLFLYPTFPLLVGTMGSETPLYLAFCLGACALYARKWYALVGLFLGLAILTRGDGAVVVVILGVDYLIREWPLGRKRSGAGTLFLDTSVGLAVVLAGVILPWVVFATGYFGSPLPVTLSVKRAQGIMEISEGFASGLWGMIRGYGQLRHYLVEGGLLLAGVAFALWRARGWLIFLVWPVLYALAYTALGVTRYFWYYAPLVPGIVVAVGLGIGLLSNASGSRIVRIIGITIVLVLAGFQIGDLARLRSLPDERYLAYRTVGEWLAENTLPGASIGMLEVGIIGYYARPRPMVDFAGLIQPEVALQFTPQATYQDAALWAVDEYQPDYLVLHNGLFPRLENGYVREHCQPIQRFTSAEYGYSRDLVVYDCR
ncbi:MAG: hypothetical protein ACE5GO_05270 [Anaerolineales bacterium]